MLIPFPVLSDIECHAERSAERVPRSGASRSTETKHGITLKRKWYKTIKQAALEATERTGIGVMSSTGRIIKRAARKRR